MRILTADTLIKSQIVEFYKIYVIYSMQVMEAAYAKFDYKSAKARLEAVAKRIEYKYPSADESILEGLEETLTLHRLGIPELLRIFLSSANPIENPPCQLQEKQQKG